MINSKIIIVLIVCIGVISSVFILTRKPVVYKSNSNLITTIDSIDPINDWENILKSLEQSGLEYDDLISIDKKWDEDNTLTKQVAIDFFSKYLLAKKEGVEISEQTSVGIADSVMKNLPIEGSYSLYRPSDVRIMKNVTPEAREKYMNALINALQKNSNKNNPNVLEVVSNALKSEKETDLLVLDPVISSLNGVIRDTAIIEVPIDGAPIFLLYLNATVRVYTDISDMRRVLTDPIRGYIGFSNYSKNALILKLAYEDLQAYFNK